LDSNGTVPKVGLPAIFYCHPKDTIIIERKLREQFQPQCSKEPAMARIGSRTTASVGDLHGPGVNSMS